MTEDVTRIWRLPLPAEWEPVDTWCVTFSIPAGDDYVSALSAAVGLLTKQKTFERDKTHTGAKTVAHTWESVLYEKAMLVQPDGCGYAPPINPPEIPDNETAYNYSAMVIRFMQNAILAPIVACAGPGTGGNCIDCVDSVMTSLGPYGASPQLRSQLQLLCNQVQNSSPEQLAELTADCVWTGEWDDIAQKIKDEHNWLQHLSDWLFSWLQRTSNTLFDMLNSAAAMMGGNGIGGWIGDNGGGGGGAGFGSDCPWVITIDFTHTQGPFDASGLFTKSGHWEAGQGWLSDFYLEYVSYDGMVVDISSTFNQSTHVTYAKIVRSGGKGSWDQTGTPIYDYLGVGASLDRYNGPAGTGIVFEMLTPGDNAGMRIQFIAGTVHKGGDNPGGFIALTFLELHGTGPKPWG